MVADSRVNLKDLLRPKISGLNFYPALGYIFRERERKFSYNTLKGYFKLILMG